MIETWYKIWCPRCEIPNWICNGDTSDMTVPDIEAIECFNCGKKFWIDETQIGMENYSHLLEDGETTLDEILEDEAYYEKGKPSPTN